MCGGVCEINFTLSADVYFDFSELSIQILNGSSLKIYISVNPTLCDTLVLSKINEIFSEK